MRRSGTGQVDFSGMLRCRLGTSGRDVMLGDMYRCCGCCWLSVFRAHVIFRLLWVSSVCIPTGVTV